MRLLVLGGTSFVGRWVVTAAAERGWSVTTYNRGTRDWAHPQAERVIGDRRQPDDLAQLRGGRWDAVVDTWSGAPRAVCDSASLLARQASRYVYISSRSVYVLPSPAGLDESCPTVTASADADDEGYAGNKRGGEMAAEHAFGGRAVLARAGLILGPHEDVGRLPWWLRRLARGGTVLAPGPPDLPVQYIDARDLAEWVLGAIENEVSGPVNLVCRQGHATMQGLLAAATAVTGGGAQLEWVDEDTVLTAGIQPWSELPLWIPPTAEGAELHATVVDRAYATGLRCRPLGETVADTWSWMVSTDHLRPPSDGRVVGLDPRREQAVLATWRSRRSREAGPVNRGS